MDYDDILYFDWKSGDDITLNLNYKSTKFLWYTNVRGPVTFTFQAGKLEVKYRNFLLQFSPTEITIFSDYNPRTFGKKAPESLTTFTFDDAEDANTIWRGVEKLLKTYPSKKLGKGSFEFDPSVLRE